MAAMRPLVGLTAEYEHVEHHGWSTHFSLLHGWYHEAVEDAGGSPVLLPPQVDASEVVNRLDALILTGGPDVDARLYGATPHEASDTPRPERDFFEMSAYRAARVLGIPVLAICRGLQVMAVAEGGSLIQHLPDVTDLSHGSTPGVFGEHVVTLAEGSRLHEIYGEEVNVATHHHQAVLDPGALTPVGWADDRVIEAAEIPGEPFVVGCSGTRSSTGVGRCLRRSWRLPGSRGRGGCCGSASRQCRVATVGALLVGGRHCRLSDRRCRRADIDAWRRSR